ncbi:hypothetical protein [Chitinophaga rhizophila]|uniref:Lipoprotein n=1 Tax=Chitinophaga rhizophila TaxID=2866212 RepID=A0ABS7GIG1_9BACT|nr:hypothetical protein [Chitinophaga rhizophila]MBW8687453.1 hypothetical protein [Chitinophaga rhizophila]
MKNHSYFLLALALAGCVENKQQEQQADNTVQQAEKPAVTKPSKAPATPAVKHPLPEKIVRERASGTVTLLDAANGKPVAEVNDNVELEAGIPEKGWSATLVTTELTANQEEGQILKKGTPIIADGKTVGKLLKDVEIEMTYKNDKGVHTGVFHAAVQQSSIKPASVIENALAAYLKQHPERTKSDMQSFIKQFQLEALDNSAPFKEYYNYESAADDPSPGFRTVLVFHKDKLIGIVDSRKIQLEGVKHTQLDRGYNGYFFPDTEEGLKKKYITKFNQFVNSAD